MARSPREDSETDDVTLALTLMISGGLCYYAPRYFGAVSWQETIWHVAGLVMATSGAIALLAELSPKEDGKTVLSDLAVGLICLGLALVVALAIAAWSLPSPFEGLGRCLVAFFVFFGTYGCSSGVVQSLRRRHSSGQPARRGQTISAIILALLGLATAVLNLYAAFSAIPARP